MKRLVSIFLLCLACQPLLSQEEMPQSWKDAIEEWAEEEDDACSAEELSELYAQLAANPILINDTVSHPLRALFFVSPMQEGNLVAYIWQHGFIRSQEELYLVNGFDSSVVELLRPVVDFSVPQQEGPLRLRDVLRYGRHNLVVGGNTTFERARGYREDVYEGDCYRLYMRYLFHYSDRVQLLLSADKDAGEALFAKSQPQGFDFYNFYLMVNKVGRVKRAIVGRYRLQFGQGLTLWSGFAPYSGMAARVYRHAQGIRPASALAEYGYQQGAATTVGITSHIEATAFYSNVDRDGTAHSLSESGYHRYSSELDKKDFLTERLFGAHIAYRTSFADIGITACRTLLSQEITPTDYVYNALAFRGESLTNIGIDGAYRKERLLLFGELAMSHNLRFAGIAGMQLQLSSDCLFSAYYRDYAADYWNLHTAGLGRSGTQNEQGLCFIWQSRLPWRISLLTSADLFRSPWMRNDAYAPTDGYECKVQMTRPVAPNTTLTVFYRSKMRGRNGDGDTLQTYAIEKSLRHQVQGNIQWTHNGWGLVTRVGYVWAEGETEETSSGLLLYQDIKYKSPRMPITLSARFALFDVDDYDARIYAIESDFLYEYSSSMFMYQGLRSYLLVKYDISPDLAIGMKYGITHYANRATTGSGYEETDEPHKQTLKVQLRWKF